MMLDVIIEPRLSTLNNQFDAAVRDTLASSPEDRPALVAKAKRLSDEMLALIESRYGKASNRHHQPYRRSEAGL